MNDIIKFVTAESAAESEPLFRSMSHEELVQNCMAAQQLIGTQISRAEYHKERADRITELAKKVEVVCRSQRSLFESMEQKLSTTTKQFAGRDKRKARGEIYALVLATLRETLAVPVPKIDWPSDDIYSPNKVAE